ncbi:uncharacterized protein Bfra_006408 [Botrytis fragariae]|uniref:Uncharacterized protein n=1 Tax=Botrytis fragariae TaxID=1964551 RepID=A0A8H6B4D2_9HELO|nr:uncharacterized protein Bfra_006408 [Botrytis fragariae]KAF5879203.1 hypothetical protein Bfra_006408 [Botrytis fragariae]
MGAIAPETKFLCTREAVTDGRLSDVFCTDDILERGLRRNVARKLSYVDVGEQRQKGKPEKINKRFCDRELLFPIENERIQERKIKKELVFLGTKQHSRRLEFLQDLESWKRCRKRELEKDQERGFDDGSYATSSSLLEWKCK